VLRQRCRLVVFQKVAPAALNGVLDRALSSDAALRGCTLAEPARKALVAAADGDVRVALNTLELAAGAAGAQLAADGSSGALAWTIEEAAVLSAVQRRATYYGPRPAIKLAS
jgi:replication-associated recombination protein RarA